MPEAATLDYLAREPLTEVEFLIEDNHISISSPHTSYVNQYLNPPVEKQALLDLYAQILAVAKERKVRISYPRHIRKTIRERWQEYADNVEERDAIFQQMIWQARIVEQRGLHMGTSDDDELHNLAQLTWRFQKYGYLSGIIDKFSCIHRDLVHLLEEFSDSSIEVSRINL